MTRSAVLLLAVLACQQPYDPYAGSVDASISFVVPPSPDSMYVTRWATGERWELGSGDSVCVHFVAEARMPQHFTIRTRYQPPRELVWWTPTVAWPHLDVFSMGDGTLYTPARRRC